jgi:hypothetical protein
LLTFRIVRRLYNPGNEVGGTDSKLHSLRNVSRLDQSRQSRVDTLKTLENQPLRVFLMTLVILTLGILTLGAAAIAQRRFGLADRVWPVAPCLVPTVFAAGLAIGGRLSLSSVAAIEPSSVEDSV